MTRWLTDRCQLVRAPAVAALLPAVDAARLTVADGLLVEAKAARESWVRLLVLLRVAVAAVLQ
jgi:hypothetical protein